MMNETTKQIGTIIAQRQEQSDRRDISESCRSYTTRQLTLRRSYPDLSEFLTAYNPDTQIEYKAAESVFTNIDKAATLNDVNNAYEENAASQWLIPQLADLSEFCGCRTKISNEQIESLARLLAAEYGYITIPEFMLFFHRFKKGEYGQFYGNVDPMVITSSFCSFIEWRNRRLDDIRARNSTEKKWDSYEQYQEAARRQAQYIASQKSKSIGFTPRSDKTKVSSIGDVMRGMNK